MTDNMQPNRKRGAPIGNHNARTHGFYSLHLTARQRRALEAASYLKGLDQEIAIVRMKIEDILATAPENIEVLMLAISMLVKLKKAEKLLSKDGEFTEEKFARGLQLAASYAGLQPVIIESGDMALVPQEKTPENADYKLLVKQKEELDALARGEDYEA